MISQSV